MILMIKTKKTHKRTIYMCKNDELTIIHAHGFNNSASKQEQQKQTGPQEEESQLNTNMTLSEVTKQTERSRYHDDLKTPMNNQ